MNKVLKISSFCSPFLVTVEKEASLVDIMKIMKEADIRHIPVTEDDKLIGIISERDLKVFEDREFANKFCAGDIMVSRPYSVAEDCDLREVVDKMLVKKYGSCLVHDSEGKVNGIFTMVDALRTLSIILNSDDGGSSLFKEHEA